MALNIKDERTDHLARELARLTGQSITEAVAQALEEKTAGGASATRQEDQP
jgi:antitoxin VapB